MNTSQNKFQDFLSRFGTVPIDEYSNKVMGTTPLVSVSIETFQHEKYIAQCLDSILSQKTGFNFEILLGEDSSSDGTREICTAYADRYPNLIRLFLHERRNNISIAGRPSGRFNLLYNLFSARGKYVARCEGDDYWSDPLKLQKQVDALEEEPSASMVFTSADRWVKGRLVDFYPEQSPPDLFSLEDFIFRFQKLGVPTCTTMLKRQAMNEIIEALSANADSFLHADYLMWCIAGKHGQFRFLNEKTGVYRVHSTSLIRTSPRRGSLEKGMALNRFLADYLGTKFRKHFLSGDWWYHLEFSFLEIQQKNRLGSMIPLLRSLITATRYGQRRHLRIIRDYLYRLRQSMFQSGNKSRKD